MADKQLRLTHTEVKKSAISTLMTADVEGIEATLPSIHDLWGFLLDIGFGLYFLSKFISLATFSIFFSLSLYVSFCPFSPQAQLTQSLVSVIYGFLIGKWSAKALSAWNASIQSRVSKMTNILSQQIPLRMTGLGRFVGQYAQNLRVAEMQCSKQYRVCTTTTMTGGMLRDEP